jgi:uncharacterized protein YPO0396
MIELRRIILIDWYLFRAEQIDLGGLTALIGPNGAGKSAIIDAAQTVLTGANMMSIRFNPSAQSVTRSKRSIRDYCLGVVSLDEKGERSEPTRHAAYTYVILGFEDAASGAAINLGVAFAAHSSRPAESCEARFQVRGALIGMDDLLETVADGEVETRQWHGVRALLRARDLTVEDSFGSASEFVEEALRALSPSGYPLEPRRFIKAFRNALLLKPVENPTEFVRTYVLDVPPIQVDRLRRSIDLYRSLTGKIESLKAQNANLAQIQRIVGRVHDNEHSIRVAQWQIARLHWERFRRDLRRLQSELKRLRAEAEARQRETVAADANLSRVDADHARLELKLKSSDGAQLASMYASDRDAEIAKRANAMAPVKALDQLIARIGTLIERRIIAGRDDILHGLLSSVALSRSNVDLPGWERELPTDWQESATHLDAALASVTGERLESVRKLVSDSFVAAQLDVRDIQERIAQIDANLKRLDQGRSPIEPGTAALIGALEAVGMKAEPLCDLVEVRDPKWRLAAEAVLGWSREALIVDPDDAVRALEIYRAGREDAYPHAEVVNTTKTAQTRPCDSRSLAAMLTTTNKHVRAFLDFRLGRLMLVDTIEKLLAAENAITPDRMIQSGRTVRRLPHPVYLKLGRASEDTRRMLNEERGNLTQKLAEKSRAARQVQDDSMLIENVVRAFEELRANGTTCVAAGQTLANFDREIAKAIASMEEAKRLRDPELVKELDRLKAELASARARKSAADRAWQEANGAENRVVGNYETRVRDDHDRLRADRRSQATLLPHEAGSVTEARAFEPVVRGLPLDALSGEIDSRKGDVNNRVTNRRPFLQRELSTALLKHCQQFSVSLPFAESDAAAEVVGPWAADERQRLETHVLVQYEEQCRNAAGQMTGAFRDDLLHRLHDAFEGIKETLSELNRHLKDRVFHSRDYYRFKSTPSATHADMIELVQESRRPDFQLPLFAAQDKDAPETAVLRAVRRIEQILADPEAKTEEIEDPRKYFNFELIIEDAQGKIRSSLTSRAGTGSGGEGQLPFYIAIGASLAATYQNRRTGETGLALAVFDEAFNRLDTAAIGACCDFMRALGLQVVLATPDEKRHVFMEMADTVVNVNRTGNQVLIATEYLTEKTRTALSEADPYRKGFEAFKAERIAAARVPIERQEAAE